MKLLCTYRKRLDNFRVHVHRSGPLLHKVTTEDNQHVAFARTEKEAATIAARTAQGGRQKFQASQAAAS